MTPRQPLLMIPGPIELSPAVLEAYAAPTRSHVAADVIEAFGGSLEAMRQVWCASPGSQPFVVAGSGTIAMEIAVTNIVDPGDNVLVVNTGYFSDRIAEMFRRRGADVVMIGAELGACPEIAEVRLAAETRDFKVLAATHVDTSSGVRLDAKAFAGLARDIGALSVFDGVCATAAERFAMDAWGADLYVTASQKAIGLPPGLALLVASPAAMEARGKLGVKPPMSLDFDMWRPIMEAYEARRPSYFSTPATNLIAALRPALAELVDATHGADAGMEAVFRRHERVGAAMRASWAALGCELLPASNADAANTLSAVCYPAGVGPELTGAIKAAGAIVAGGLFPGRKGDYFRVGHMGWVTTQPDLLLATVDAVESGLRACGHDVAPGSARSAAQAVLDGEP